MHFSSFNNDRLKQQLHGERFSVTYRLYGTEDQARQIANEIIVEQTVEFPYIVLPEGEIKNQILGRIESFTRFAEGAYDAKISYPVENVGPEFTQLLNTIFGNFSIKEHVKVVDLDLPDSILKLVKGPRFGIEGIRKLVGAPKRPLIFTALKPLGLDADNFAELAYTFAKSGIDIIKDDHGIANQTFAPFRERVEKCAKAVARANAETGGHTLYVPNLTGPIEHLRENALFAKQVGAGGLMLAPGLVGLDTMRAIAEDDEIGLPVFSHPSFIGSYAVNPQGISCQLLFGTLMRLAGADAVIFPNYGGRFTFSVEECVGAADNGRCPMGDLKTMFSCPAGGMQLAKIPDMLEKYGMDVILLIGGGLFTSGPDLEKNCKVFVDNVSAYE